MHSIILVVYIIYLFLYHCPQAHCRRIRLSRMKRKQLRTWTIMSENGSDIVKKKLIVPMLAVMIKRKWKRMKNKTGKPNHLVFQTLQSRFQPRNLDCFLLCLFVSCKDQGWQRYQKKYCDSNHNSSNNFHRRSRYRWQYCHVLQYRYTDTDILRMLHW